MDASHADALHLLGVLAHQAGQNDSAVEMIVKAIGINPAIAAYHANLGTALKALGRLDEAVAAYNNALRLKPDYAEAHYNQGNTLKDLATLDDAVAAYNNAIRLKPDYVLAHSHLGNSLQDLGRLDDAVAAYNAAIRFKPDFAEAHANLGNALRALGRLDEAAIAYNNAIRLRPDFAEAHSNLGNALKDLGRLDEAVAAYRNAIRCKPDFAEAHSILATSCKNWAASTTPWPPTTMPSAASLTSSRPTPTSATLLKELGRLDDAVAAYNNAIRCKPDFAEAHSNLGNALKESGTPRRGRRRLQYRHPPASRNSPRLTPTWAPPCRSWGASTRPLAAYNTAIRLQAGFRRGPLQPRQHPQEVWAVSTRPLPPTTLPLPASPTIAQAHFNLGIGLLLSGDFSNGWTEYDWRWRGGVKEQKPRDFSTPAVAGRGFARADDPVAC